MAIIGPGFVVGLLTLAQAAGAAPPPVEQQPVAPPAEQQPAAPPPAEQQQSAEPPVAVAPAEPPVVAAPAAPAAPPSTATTPPAATPPPPPAAADADVEASDGPDPWARPHFVKGDLNSFAVRPGPRRNFIGVAGGVSAVPTTADALFNAFYATVEPIVEIHNPKYNWKLSLGAPLQFELVDTRGALEVCVGEAKLIKSKGGDRSAVETSTAACIGRQQDRATEGMGRLRSADWDEASDFAKLIRHAVIGGQERPFYLSLSRLYDQSFGHGTVVRHYNPNIDYNTARLGLNLDLNRSAVGVQAMANDLVRPDVVGILGFVRPFRPYSDNVLLRGLSVGASWTRGSNQPKALRYESGLFGTSFDKLIPEVDADLHLVGQGYHQASIIGVNVETKLVRSDWADVKVYADYDKMADFGSGFTLGSLFRLSFGRPATQALRARAEVSLFGPSFLPNYFDTFHDIFQYQYLPVGYRASNGNTYYPTKIEYLEANRGGSNRVGGYLEITHAVFDALTLTAVLRGHRPYGSPGSAGFVGPSFPDYGGNCPEQAEGGRACASKITLGREPGFSALRLSAELPFRRFLQAYASYEVFSSTTDGGLGAFKFDGDNEVLFSGARIMLLPFLFLQAEARRYFFLQRLSSVNINSLTFEQNQNLHSLWTLATNVAVGWEF